MIDNLSEINLIGAKHLVYLFNAVTDLLGSRQVQMLKYYGDVRARVGLYMSRDLMHIEI